MDRCADCRFQYDDVPRAAIAGSPRSNAQRYAARLAVLDDVAVRAHPVADTWSVLEHACHLRDIFRIQATRVQLAITEQEPSFEPMGRDQRAVEKRYNGQAVPAVTSELQAAAADLAGTFDGLSHADWQRRGFYNWPTRQLRTVEWIGRHTVHEAEHHWRDIDRLVDEAQGSPR